MVQSTDMFDGRTTYSSWLAINKSIKHTVTETLQDTNNLYSYPGEINSLWQNVNIHKEVNSSALNVT